MGINDFRLPVVGCGYENEDGTSRQEEIARCGRGDPIRLVREPDNPNDPAAVAVLTGRGVRIGYLGAARAGWIGSKIDRGYDVRACISRVRGMVPPLAVVISLNMDGEDPEAG